ncbi:DUF2242 domain-containing protein [Paraburkholderia sp.]|uniref:DUF2242 domain-containing protein n=1 Tax=Paraburkholderia sp. TaxID=1926495 RepID=UPI003D6E6A53
MSASSSVFSVFLAARRAAGLAATAALLLLGACAGTKPPAFQQELFDTGSSPYARGFNASTADTCEGARRALLSQGYMTTMTRNDTVDGTKNFQPTSDSHIVVEFHVVCTPGVEQTNTSVVYVNAVQNGYAMKKSDTSASVGLSILGSLSLPIRSNNDAMVKVSSETIPSGKFYERFFALVDHYLQTVVRAGPVSTEKVDARPLPGGDVPVAPAPAAVPVAPKPSLPAVVPATPVTAAAAAAAAVAIPTLAAPAAASVPAASSASSASSDTPDAIERAAAGGQTTQAASDAAAVH